MRKLFVPLSFLLISGIFFTAYTINNKSIRNDRYERGWLKLKEIDGEAGENVIESLKEISPEFGNYIIEYVFGDVYCRNGISDKEREIAVIASLTGLGNAEPQLKVHLNAALNVGCTPVEIIEVINQTSPYTGIPSSLNALNIFREVIIERDIVLKRDDFNLNKKDIASIYEIGEKRLNNLLPNQTEKLNLALGNLSPEIVDYIILTYGDVLNEDLLSPRLRQIATIASLTAIGTAKPQLQLHIKGAMNIGVTVEEIKEIMITMSVYAGFPATLNGLFALQEIIDVV